MSIFNFRQFIAAKTFGEDQLDNVVDAVDALYACERVTDDLEREVTYWQGRAHAAEAQVAHLNAHIDEKNLYSGWGRR